MLSRWLIANWLSGYYHVKHNNSMIDLPRRVLAPGG
jgi:hypothetical protein